MPDDYEVPDYYNLWISVYDQMTKKLLSNYPSFTLVNTAVRVVNMGIDLAAGVSKADKG